MDPAVLADRLVLGHHDVIVEQSVGHLGEHHLRDGQGLYVGGNWGLLPCNDGTSDEGGGNV